MTKSFLVVFILLFSVLAYSGDLRYCADQPQRYEDGTIKRSAKVVRQFRLLHPCPVTKLTSGACPGWQIDHVIPLSVGGCDATWNMQWLPVEIKTCPGEFCKDRWERRVYSRDT